MWSHIYPPAAEVLEMEPEELAPFVLRHLDSEGGGKLNRHNFTVGTDPEFKSWADTKPKEILQRLMIAWMWLEKELFIAPSPGENNWYFITPKGNRILDEQDFDTYKKDNLLPSEGLDPILVRKVKTTFLRGDYDTAIFQAFKEVEVRVRKKAGLSNADIGVSLMRQVFKPDSGILTDTSAEKGEQVARMELFAGAVGTYKNPSSHRDVGYSDPKEAADIIHLANQLLRIVENIKKA